MVYLKMQQQAQILKRLEVIRASIPLEDIEIIELQVLKLKTMAIDNDVKIILQHIEQNNFSPLTSLITNYLNHFSGLKIYEDPRIGGFKVELKILEKEFLKLSEETNAIENLIEEFNHKYILYLGDILEEILEIKAKKEENSSAKTEFKNFKEEFKKEQKREFEKKTLTQDEEQNLKKMYREASKLCHPDLVADELKRDAEEIFKELNEAKSNNDIKRVSEILEALKNGEHKVKVGSDKIDNIQLLEKRISELKTKISEIKVKIENLKDSETYILIKGLEDWEYYFSEVKKQLELELENLKR